MKPHYHETDARQCKMNLCLEKSANCDSISMQVTDVTIVFTHHFIFSKKQFPPIKEAFSTHAHTHNMTDLEI